MRIVLVVSIVMLLAACGQKGPLYLRDQPPPGVKPPKEEPYRAKPYPKDAASDDAKANAEKKKETTGQ